MNATKCGCDGNKIGARNLFPDENWIFQDEYAPCHQAKLVKRWMQSHRVAQMNWPAQSPDLNPTENLWHNITVPVISAKSNPSNNRELIENIFQAWHYIHSHTGRTLQPCAEHAETVQSSDSE